MNSVFILSGLSIYASSQKKLEKQKTEWTSKDEKALKNISLGFKRTRSAEAWVELLEVCKPNYPIHIVVFYKSL